MPTSIPQETLESFSDFLGSKGLRMTDQRKGVFEALFKQTGHFTAEQLLQDAKNVDDTVSRATVYRCLPLLVESGVIRKIDVGQENKYYALKW
jgi:Fur family ferric uptake transcriptional regulator